MIDALSLLPQYTPDQYDSRYRLVLVASQRAKYLIQGGKPTTGKFTKYATVALDEALYGHIEYLCGKEARQAQKDTKRGREADAERMAVVAGEDAQEIKKELSVYVDDSEKTGGIVEPEE